MEQIEQMKNEANKRIDALIELGLNPNVKTYFNEGRIYYSYLTCGGMMGSSDTVEYDPRYNESIKRFEEETGYLVYHAIESILQIGDQILETLALLYVSIPSETGDNSNWEYERLDSNKWIGVYCKNLTLDDLSVVGSIQIETYGGALIRVA